MKKMTILKKVFFLVLTFSMVFTFASVAYANDDSNRDFEAKRSIVEEINARYGMSFNISPLSEEASYGLEPMSLEEFRALLTEIAQHQAEVNALVDELENSEATLFAPFSTSLGWFHFNGTGRATWNVTGSPTITVSATIRAEVFRNNNNMRYTRNGHFFHTSASAHQTGGASNVRVLIGPLSAVTTGITNSGAVAIIVFNVPVGLEVNGASIGSDNLRIQTNFNIF